MSVSGVDEPILLNAYLDGELGAIEAARFEQRLAKELESASEVDAGCSAIACVRVLPRISAPVR